MVYQSGAPSPEETAPESITGDVPQRWMSYPDHMDKWSVFVEQTRLDTENIPLRLGWDYRFDSHACRVLEAWVERIGGCDWVAGSEFMWEYCGVWYDPEELEGKWARG